MSKNVSNIYENHLNRRSTLENLNSQEKKNLGYLEVYFLEHGIRSQETGILTFIFH